MTTVEQELTPTAGAATRLRQLAIDRPDQVAVRELDHGRWQQRTFRELDQLVDLTCHALTRHGIKRGMRTVLMIPPGREFLACAFALLRIGAPPVMVDPGMGIAGLGRCLERAAPEAFIGIARAQRARALLGWARSTIRHRISVAGGWNPPFTASLDQWRRGCELAVPYQEQVLDSKETAAILFTSGSTGPAKGAISHHGLIDQQIEWIGRLHGIEAGEVDLATFPLFALFSVALGMTTIIPDIDFTRPADADPAHILDLIEQFDVTSMFASPALLGNLARYMKTESRSADRLRRVISAGAPARHDEIDQLLASLPSDVKIETPYGATEAMPLCLIDHREFLDTREQTCIGQGVCVGQPISGIQIRISAIDRRPESDDCVTEGTPGEIWASGPVVSRGYLEDRSADQEHKYVDGEGILWHRTGDLGCIDTSGKLWFRGRRSQMVQTNRGDLHTVAIERVFDVHPDVRRTALVGNGPVGQQIPILCIEAVDDSAHRQAALIEELKALGSMVAGADRIEDFCFPGPFPVDIRHNAKIDRSELAHRAAGIIS